MSGAWERSYFSFTLMLVQTGCCTVARVGAGWAGCHVWAVRFNTARLLSLPWFSCSAAWFAHGQDEEASQHILGTLHNPNCDSITNQIQGVLPRVTRQSRVNPSQDLKEPS